ncbi:L-gulonolactone oxidase 3-like [Phragmites australis]|uniref:L-gulonolactone oxidase 3-like n=1 Tax=Phragmites australis TaxID=29695 RepID=UPI002D771EDD|nr:L-gulonolactone oxidase 3-like [Phragmites australis]
MIVTFLLLLLSSLVPGPALALPPRPPVRCGDGGAGCVLSNAYGAWSSDRADCPVSAVAYPASEQDVVAAVARASANSARVKVVSGFAHTIPKLACPGGGGGGNGTLLISTARLAGVEVDAAGRTVTADAGAPLRAVIDAAEARELSLTAAPYWDGVSIAGLVSTGSHGSSWWGRGGAVHDYVVGLRLVVPAGEADGWARVLELQKGDDLFPAALVSLGLLGVVSKITLSLEPRFKRSITYDYRDDSTFQDDFAAHAARHEFADIAWYPSQHTAVYRVDDRAPLNASGDGGNDFIGFQSTSIVVSAGIRALETSLERSKNVRGKCTMAAAEIAAKRLVGNGLKNNALLFSGYPVVGFQGKMQTSGSCSRSPAADLLSACAWDPRFHGLFFYESTAFFSPARFRDFILDVKRLRDLAGPDKLCGVDVYNGILVRFVRASAAYLGQHEDSVVVDFNYYRASNPATPRLSQDVWEEVEQLAFVKHGARPHWAKNRMVAFAGVQGKYPRWGAFARAKRQLDPRGLFDSLWSDEVVGGVELSKGDGCALDGRCVCSEDRHCSPSQGYYCRPGLVFTEARVCRDLVSQDL